MLTMRIELNPNHPVTAEMRENWHKIAALIMHKLKTQKVIITLKDIQELDDFLQGGAICAHPSGDVLEIFLVDGKEAQRLAREEGGLPV